MLNDAYATTRVGTRPHANAAVMMSRNAIASILTAADIVLDLDVPTRERALEEIARIVGARHGLLPAEVYTGLAERERIGSTALGCGIAIPHARMKRLARPVAAYVRTRIPIPFDAPDGKPVSDMFALLVPQHSTDAHLGLLAQVAEIFCDAPFREGLRALVHADEVHAALAR